ncbi:MAG TPA: cell filamentation protein Fic [Ignavibacteria bacterium]|nr:cell filamentation protein Fic [Ignavibacteria bacterium]
MKKISTNNEIIIYKGDNGEPKLEVQIENDTVWLSQAQIVELFQSSKSNVSEHIKRIFEEGELCRDAVVRKIRTTASDGKNYDVEHYNLDMIISLGYRIKSSVATHFRIWATARLHEYIVKGFTMDDERLKDSSGGSYWKELLNRIRDIRSSEKVLYRQVLDLYTTSMNYNPKSPESVRFFKTVQNKLHYATNKQTAAETIASRADAEKDFMGLATFTGQLPTKAETIIAKNYLNEDELFRLNRMVSAFFDLAEIKAQEHTKMRMKDWVTELDKFAEMYGKGVLKDAGKISHEKAISKAEKEYKKYQVKTFSPVEKAYLDTLKAVQEKISRKRKRKLQGTKNSMENKIVKSNKIWE